MPGCELDVPADKLLAKAEAPLGWFDAEAIVAPSLDPLVVDELVLWNNKNVGADDDCWCSLLREPSFAMAGVGCADVLGRLRSSIPLVPPASCCLDVPLFPERLDVRDDVATATVELATALVEADEETQDPVVDEEDAPLLRELRLSRLSGG